MIERRLRKLAGRALLLAAVVVASLTVGPSLSAGSNKPNPAALQKAAAVLAEEQAGVQKEVDTLLHRLATDADFCEEL
jgi:hypothetical protein